MAIAYSELGRRSRPAAIARLMAAALENRDLLSLAAGFTDNQSLPCSAVAQISADLLAAAPPADVLQYGTNAGRPALRTELASRLNRLDGTPEGCRAEQMLITNGSQQALYLAMQTLADPGDIILVDRPSYFVFLEMLQGLGLRAVSLPVDENGRLDLPALQDYLRTLDQQGERPRVKAVYLVSYFSNPSSRTLTLAEKTGLARVLQAGGWTIPVLEDAAYRELAFADAPPPPSVLALPEWCDFPKLYLGTLTKPFATGLKIGYGLCTDEDWLAKMLAVKGHHDFGSAQYNQAILERALLEGHYDAQVRKLRLVYREKRDALEAGLQATSLRAQGWSWSLPQGGLYHWLTGPQHLDTGFDGPLFARAVRTGVLYVPGVLCFGDAAPTSCVRLSFGVLPPARLGEAAARFGEAMRSALG